MSRHTLLFTLYAFASLSVYVCNFFRRFTAATKIGHSTHYKFPVSTDLSSSLSLSHCPCSRLMKVRAHALTHALTRTRSLLRTFVARRVARSEALFSDSNVSSPLSPSFSSLSSIRVDHEDASLTVL